MYAEKASRDSQALAAPVCLSMQLHQKVRLAIATSYMPAYVYLCFFMCANLYWCVCVCIHSVSVCLSMQLHRNARLAIATSYMPVCIYSLYIYIYIYIYLSCVCEFVLVCMCAYAYVYVCLCICVCVPIHSVPLCLWMRHHRKDPLTTAYMHYACMHT
jgi:hypothetical protein